MNMRRRDFVKAAGAAVFAPALSRLARGADSAGVYDFERFGNARILHMTDTHAQLLPVYFREPSVNLGIGAMAGQAAASGRPRLSRPFRHQPDSADAYAFTFLDFEKSAARFGKLGGFAHLKTLIDRLRGDAGHGRSLLLDGGDLWQGTGLANTMQGADMVEAANLLGIEAMTGHWEFTYGEKALRDNLARFKGEFLAQNVFLTEEAAFNDAKAFDPASGRVFKPAIIKEIGGFRVAVIGQAFPYVPIAHPRRFTPDWTFGIRDDELQKLVDTLRTTTRSMRWCCSRITAWMSISSWRPRHRHRRHSRRPHPRRRAAADPGEKSRRHHARHQCRLERKIPGRARSRTRQKGGSPTCATGCCRCFRNCSSRMPRWRR